MKHVVPESHLELLQAIYRELVLARDEQATFVAPDESTSPEDES